MNIAEVRQKFPEYGALTDQQLASALYEKHYADSMTQEDFFERVGVEIPQPKDSGWQNALDVLGEFAAAANRSVTELIDLAPSAVEGLLNVAGVEADLPKLTEMLSRVTTGNFMEPGLVRSAVRGAGSVLPAGGAGMVPVAGRNVATARGAAAEFLGAGTAKNPQGYQPAATMVRDAMAEGGVRATARAAPGALAESVLPGAADKARTEGVEKLRHTMPGARAARAAADAPIKSGRDDVAAAGYKANPADPGGLPIIDPKQQAALGSGFGEDFVSLLHNQNDATKAQMRKIIEVARRGQASRSYKARNRPLDVPGQSLLDRIKITDNARVQAGKDLTKARQGLRGQYVDPTEATDRFLGALRDMDIAIDPGTMKLDFADSEIGPLKKFHKPINQIMNHMRKFGNVPPDAYEIDKLKRIIDNVVDYSDPGLGKQGLAASAERALKGLRRDLDAVLDGAFPAYDDANRRYSETKTALDETRKAVGKRIDFTSDSAATSLGSKVRGLSGNYNTRGQLNNAIDKLDAVVEQYNTPTGVKLIGQDGKPVTIKVTDDLHAQVDMIAEIERLIGTPAANSFLGDITKGAERASEIAQGRFAGPVTDMVRANRDVIRKRREARAIDYLMDMLED